jgi:hypothetical protein
MPKTEILNDPLAAEEIKEIVIQKIRAAMDKNCTLVDDLTFAGFRVRFEVNFTFVRSPIPSTLVWGDAVEGEQVGELDHVTAASEYESDPSPNRTREDNDLPLPAMVMTPSGPQRRRVRIANAGKK